VTSTHLAIVIDCSADDAYAYASDPLNLPEWAAGLSTGIREENGVWVSDSPMGRIVVEFAQPNVLGVLDHVVTLASGERFYNPMRVIPDGAMCEVVFSLRRQATMDDAAFEADRAAVEADLRALKEILEG
jgi:hypothetical protein